jgi:hypothetical protein
LLASIWSNLANGSYISACGALTAAAGGYSPDKAPPLRDKKKIFLLLKCQFYLFLPIREGIEGAKEFSSLLFIVTGCYCCD